MSKISIFPRASETKNGKVIDMDLFLDGVQNGKWQDIVLPIRAMKDKTARTEAKKKVPYVTVSGTFRERNNKGLLEPSGFIAIDIDNIDPEETKDTLRTDRHVYAMFTSISGKGLCLIFKIDSKKHAEAFEGIQEYLFVTYNLVVDSAARDLSRPRFISFDPHIFINQGATKFTAYHKPIKALTKVPQVVYVQSDFDSIIKEITARNIDITGDYHQWLAIGYGLADKFGEVGRSYFHDISQFSHLYKHASADKQYDACLRRSSSSKTSTIGTVIYLAKLAGIQTTSERTKLITTTAALAKKGRRTKDDTVKLLQDVEGISPSESEDIINQVYDNNIQPPTDESPVEAIENWLRQNYDFRRNYITRYIENGNTPMQEKDFNSIFIAAKKLFDKEVTNDLIKRIINSNFTSDYNPLLEFFLKHQTRKPKGCIKALFDTVESDTGLMDAEFFPEYKSHFGTKWMVGIISAIHGKHSPLMLVLSGNKQGSGKTEFFRRLLPEELHQEGRLYPDYYAESKLDAGKDDNILMTQKLIIMDDEMGGKNKKEEKKLKELLSKQTFSLREPYGSNNVDLQRLAVLCGTTNENEILNDPTGNRRIIPINVLSINHTAYNDIDKTDLLMEAYWLWKDGYRWELSSDDVRVLNANTGHFEQSSAEYDLFVKHFKKPGNESDPWSVFMTSTEIKSILEMKSGQKLNPNRLGIELKRAGFERVSKKINGQPVKAYFVQQVDRVATG